MSAYVVYKPVFRNLSLLCQPTHSLSSVACCRLSHRCLAASIGVLSQSYTPENGRAPWRGSPPPRTGGSSSLTESWITHTHTHTNYLFPGCKNKHGRIRHSGELHTENIPTEKPTSNCSSCGPESNFCAAAASNLWKTHISKTFSEVTLDVDAFRLLGLRNSLRIKTTHQGVTIAVWPV